MRFSNDSNIVKIKGVLRFIVAKMFLIKRLRSVGLSIIGRKCDLIIKKNASISFGKKVILSGYNQFVSLGTLAIGSNVTVNEYTRIIAHQNILIGNNVTIAKFVSILDHDHQYNLNEGELHLSGYVTAPINIGNNVWIADKVTILKGVSIGDNVIVGANSVVNKDIPSNSIAAGNPCKVLKQIG